VRWTIGFGYQYPFSTQPHRVATCRWMSSGIRNGRFELTKYEPGLCAVLGPPSVALRPEVCGQQVAVSASGLATTRGLADSIQLCRLNSKTLANLLCTHRARCLRRHGSRP
jgi:hypothetical protein